MESKKFFPIFAMVLLFCSFFLCAGNARAESSDAGKMIGTDARTGNGEAIPDNIVNAAPGDIVIEKGSLNLTCFYDWTPFALTVNCTDGTNTLSADYEVAYINTDVTNSKTDQVMAHVLGIFHSNIDGIQKTGHSSGFFTGTAHLDKDGGFTSASLTVNLYGGINNDSVFQLSGKVTLTPPF